VALTNHAEYFSGDKMLWLKENMAAIDWTGREDLRDSVIAYEPPKKK
jgi:hypothetical protein